jgi:hypothetical protein
MDMKLFIENRQNFPLEELAKYAGRYVAWSPDGASIVASDEDELRLANAIHAAGHNTAEILISYVPAGDEIILGGGLEIIE